MPPPAKRMRFSPLSSSESSPTPTENVVHDSAAMTLAGNPQHPEESTLNMKLYIEELKGATDIWVRQKGGEAKLGDSNIALFRTLKLVMHGMEMCQKLEKTKQDSENNQIKTRLRRIKGALERDMAREYEDMRDRLYDEMRDVAEVAIEECMDVPEYDIEELQEKVRMEPDLLLDEEMIEVRKFVLAMMKGMKDAPETAMDRLNPEIMALD